MKKLLEILFNHELIGKDGIVVKTRKGEEIELYVSKSKLIKGDNYPIYGVKENLSEATFTLKGLEFMDNTNHNDLIMYQEVEQKEPRIIWVNIYPNSAIYAHNSKEDAFNDLMPGGETVKFIEVIEEGE